MGRQRLHHPLFTAAHLFRALLGFVLVAQQMQDAVYGKVCQLLFEGDAPLPRLPFGGLHRDHHVSEDLSREEVGGDRGDVRPLVALCKREHIGWAILAAIVAIERMDGFVIGQQQADFGAGRTLNA
jgi:hypothetical protein